MNWNNVSLIVLGLSAFSGAFTVALWISLVIWTFRDMRSRSRDAFAQLLAALMALVLGPLGALLYLLLRPRETLADKYERSLEEEALLQDIEERQICPGCKQPIESDYVLCPICHVRLRQPCVHCGRLIHPRWSLCPYCGTSQKRPAGVDEAARVTLADLERDEAEAMPEAALESEAALQFEEETIAAGAAFPEMQGELFEDDLDAGLEDEALELAAEAGWEIDELEPEEGQELADLFVQVEHEEAADDDPAADAGTAADVTASGPEPGTEQEGGAAPDTEADETPRRPLSLFRRS